MRRSSLLHVTLLLAVVSVTRSRAACVNGYFVDRAEVELVAPLNPDEAGNLAALAQSSHPVAPLASRLLGLPQVKLVPSFPRAMALAQGTLQRYYTVRFQLPSGQTVQDVIQTRILGPGVVRAARVPTPRASNDAFVGADRMLKFDNVTMPCGTQWYLHASRVSDAWASATGAGERIAVVDWGFFTAHPELVNQLDPANAYNACTNSRTLTSGPYDGHGTATAGQVGASKGDGGIQGVAFEAKLWAVQAACSTAKSKPCDAEWPDWNPWATAIAEVAFTADGPMVVLLETQTCCKGNYEASLAVQEAITVATDHKVLVVIAAGNGGKDAGMDDDGNPIPPTDAIVVGAIDYEDALLEMSNHGDRVTVSAPGDLDNDLTLATDTTYCGPAGYEIKGYTSVFGATSGAAAKVAGVVALMLEKKPDLTAALAKKCLGRGTRAENTDLKRTAGYVLDAAAAVAGAAAGSCD